MQAFGNVNGAFGDLVADTRMEEPFYVVDIADICRKVKLWKLKLPRVQPFYAVKCNPLPEVLKTLAHFGLGFDCASKNEIETALSATGVQPSKIIYANPCKTKGFIRHARDQGVKRMTFDSLVELDKIAEVHPGAELILRIKVDDSGSIMRFSSKFGADLDIVEDLLSHASALNLNVTGVSFHVGSGCCDPTCFKDAILNARWVFDLAKGYGFEMSVLDIGGGFPGNAGTEILFDRCARVINDQLDRSFPMDECTVEVIAEPGRFMVASAFTLYTAVIAKKTVADNQFMYYINDGVYGSFNCKVFDHYDPVPIPLGRSVNEPNYMSVLWGPTCDSLDKVHEGVLLPEMNVGNWLVFKDMGAYTCSAASTFNGFSKPSFHFVVSTIAELILNKTVIGRQLLDDLDHNKGFLQELFQKLQTFRPVAIAAAE